jgi:hypothetical protein
MPPSLAGLKALVIVPLSLYKLASLSLNSRETLQLAALARPINLLKCELLPYMLTKTDPRVIVKVWLICKSLRANTCSSFTEADEAYQIGRKGEYQPMYDIPPVFGLDDTHLLPTAKPIFRSRR